MIRKLYIIVLLLISSACLLSPLQAQKKFTIVIDAGHGGHDTGALGRISKEKNINLAIALKVGQLITDNYPDVKIVYTRKTDVFIPLQRRADIANENSADLFVSIHTNATKGSSASGTETYVLGLAKSASNLEVAMRENSVITLEDDYKVKYKGFDPNSIDSYIMFEFMQDRNLDKSLQMATFVESQFKRADRYSRGVRQAGFLVLHKTATPSVLVELGFISNPAEERYLNSDEGRLALSTSIFNAFESYKREFDKKNTYSNELPEKQTSLNDSNQEQRVTEQIKVEEKPLPALNNKNNNAVSFKIQLFAVEDKLSANHREFKGLKNVDYYKSGRLYIYTYGNETKYEKIESLRKSIAKKFPKAYITAFKGDEKISIAEAKKIIR